MNRIATAIAMKKAEIDGKIASGAIMQSQIDTTSAALDMELEEFAMFQEMKSLAVANQVLTLDEGQTIYVYLGEVPTTFNRQPIEVKVILTQMFKELLGLRLKAKGVKVPTSKKRR